MNDEETLKDVVRNAAINELMKRVTNEKIVIEIAVAIAANFVELMEAPNAVET